MPQGRFFCNQLINLTPHHFQDTVPSFKVTFNKMMNKPMTIAQSNITPELEIYICGACRPKNASPDNPERPGKDLAEQLQEAINTEHLNERFHVKIMQCMSVCSRPATVSLVAPGKFTFTVGDLDPKTATQDIVTFAKLYASSEDGIPAWKDRPVSFQKGVVARTPSFGASHQRITELD